ncbi:MAG: hypothetical protein K8S99_12755 [Planctomycetes bacterium]|nr:hypothetical protein [Planctomycetota bacterium]
MKTLLYFSVSVALLFPHPTLAAESAPAPPITSVHTDDHGVLLVNNKPFFPILLYDAPLDGATLTQVVDFGFNTLTVASAREAATLPAHGLYGAVHSGAKGQDLAGVLLAVGVDSPALSFKTRLIEQTSASNRQTAANCPGRPVMNAIGYWLNEPQGVKAGTLPGADKYEEMIAASIDVAAPYLYPVPHQPVDSVGDAVQRARNASGGKRMVLPILQLFTWENNDRYPTPAELRCMVFLSLARGAQGIGYYTYGSLHNPKHPMPVELWQSVKPLNARAAEVGEFLITSTRDESVAPAKATDRHSPIRARAALHGKEGLLLVVNPSHEKQTESLRLPHAAGTLKPMGDGEEIELTNGVATLMLEPFEVAVLRYTLK